MKTNLETKVQAQNAAGVLANKLTPAARAMLVPFLNTKVQLASGDGFTAKLKKAIAGLNLPHWPEAKVEHAWIGASRYSIHLNIAVGATADSGRSCRGEITTYLGDLQDGVLVRIYDNPVDFRTDYTAAEITATRAELRAAQLAVSTAQAKLFSFGEYDL